MNIMEAKKAVAAIERSREKSAGLVSMREAGELLDMSYCTLASWISAGIFRPLIFNCGPVGPGQGSRLDFSDLVTAAIIGSIIRSGVSLAQLRSVGRAKARATLCLEALSPQDRIEPVESLEDRMIQDYVKALNYEAIVRIGFVPYVDRCTEADVGICIGPLPRQTALDELRWANYERCTLIKCWFWRDTLLARCPARIKGKGNAR